MTPKRSPNPLLSTLRLRTFAVAALMLMACLSTQAQPTDVASEEGDVRDSVEKTPWLYLGAWGGFSLVAYDASLPLSRFAAPKTNVTLPPGVRFQSGDGKGGMFGLLAEFPMGESFNLGVRAGYQMHSGSLTQIYPNSTDVISRDTGGITANVQGSVEPNFGHITATIYGRIAPFSFPLYFIVGPTMMISSTAEYSYVERIGAPSRAIFKDTRTTSRTLAKKPLSDAGSIVAVTAAMGYEMPLSKKLGLFGELQFQPLLGDYVSTLASGESWTGSSLSIVAGIRFGLISSPPPPPPPPKQPKDTPVVRRPETGPFDAKGVTSAGLTDTITYTKKKVKATEVHALLPYIFFERDSAVIPERYVRLDPKNRRTFQVERLPRGSTLDLYYHLLNIVGQRIREDRVPEVILTGCISQFEKDSTLALRRAEAVRDYLVNVWRLPAKRFKIVARGLPANPSLSEVDTAEAARENQRVEIYSENYVVERPVKLPDTTFLTPVGTIRFIPPPSAPDTTGIVDGWTLDVKVGDSVIRKAVTGSGQPPKQIDFQIENRPDLDLRMPLEVSSTLTIRDTLYQDMARLSSGTVVVRGEGQYEEERTVVGARYVDEYNLLLFSFDSAEATSFSQQGSGLIKPNVDSTSTVTIVGHTDRIGLPYYNKALSQRRAEFAQQLLGLNAKNVEVRGQGEKELLYDNKFPEGRYYSRTVTVTVETPIPGMEEEKKQEERRGRKKKRVEAAPQDESDESEK